MALTKITTGEITDGTITSADMAIDPTNATNLTSGDVPLAQLGNVPAQTGLMDDIALLAFKTQANGSLARYNLVDQSVDAFEDASGVDASASTNESRSNSNYYVGGAPDSATGDMDTTTVDGTDTYYKWTTVTASGDFTPSETADYEYLVVAGGGGGGSYHSGSGPNANGGGGGAGGYRTNFSGTKISLVISTAYAITVGAGGGGGSASAPYTSGTTGSNSVLSGGAITTITSAGGGGGGRDNNLGLAGGSGGGGGAETGNPTAGGAGNTPSTSPSQGNPGGSGGISGSAFGSGGGGGHSTVGGDGSTSASGSGGDGTSNAITGSAVFYAGGGGGGGYLIAAPGSQGAGGVGGGGEGADSGSGGVVAVAGTANTGGGGGGGTRYASPLGAGATGGSGIVILRGPTPGDSEGLNLTLVSNAQTAQAVPTKGDVVLTYTNGAGTATINTDLIASVSRDNGTTYTAVTLALQGTTGGHSILTAHDVDISGQPSGSSMRWKVVTANQSAGTKVTRIQAVSLGWS